MTSKEQRVQFRDRLIQFANDIGYDVELDSPMQDHKDKFVEAANEALIQGMIKEEDLAQMLEEECRPAGDCSYFHKRIRVREDKGLNGQIATLVHELCHALGLGGHSLLALGGDSYVELAAESITEFVCTALGIDRTAKTSRRIINYGYGGYLLSPVTATFTRIILENIGIDPTTWGPANVSTDE